MDIKLTLTYNVEAKILVNLPSVFIYFMIKLIVKIKSIFLSYREGFAMKKYSFFIVVLTLFIILAGCSNQNENNLDIVQEPITDENVIGIRDFNEIDLKLFGIDQYRGSQLSADGDWLLIDGMSYNSEQDIFLSKLLLINNQTGETKVIDEADWLKINDISANGELIIYTKYEDNNWSLYLYNKEQITRLSSNFGTGSISPDSNKIAYVEYEEGLFVYEIETGSSQLLSEEKEPWYPIWFPDSKHIFYFTDLGERLGDGAGQLQGLAKINIDTKEKELITDDSGKYMSASWIKSGEVLHVFYGWDDAFGNAIVDLSTDSLLDLGEEDLYFLGGNAEVNQTKELFYLNNTDKVMIYDGMELAGEIAIDDENNPYKYMNFSPDGERMVYLSGEIYSENSAGRDIWVADADGKNTKKITSASGYYFDPIWIDDKTVVAIENTEEEFVIRYFDIVK